MKGEEAVRVSLYLSDVRRGLYLGEILEVCDPLGLHVLIKYSEASSCGARVLGEICDEVVGRCDFRLAHRSDFAA